MNQRNLDQGDQESMRSTDKRRDDSFTPDIPPTDAEALPNYIFNQVSNLAKTITNVNSIHTEKITHFEDGYKPREGDIIWAAEGLLGEESDEGLYVYMNGEWVPFQVGLVEQSPLVGL